LIIFDQILDFIAPKYCQLTGEEINSGFFSKNGFEILSGEKLIIKEYDNSSPVTGSFSLFSSSNEEIMKLVHKMKYYGKSEIASELGHVIGKKMVEEFSIFHGFDFIIPVPVHKTRLRERGYNQSIKIAEGIARSLGINVLDDLVIRNRYTNSQATLDYEKRPKNVKSAFSLNKKFDLNKIENRNILLCDDVITSGSTIRECALALKNLKIELNAVSVCVS
jgi:ComF family protein